MPIYQETNKNKIPKNGYSWFFRTYYTDMYGNRKQKQSKMYQTKTQAKEAERDFLNQIEIVDTPNHSILFEKPFNEWLEVKKDLVKPTTYYAIKKKCVKYILNFFKNHKITSINLATIREWYDFLYSYENSTEYNNVIISYLKDIFIFIRDNYGIDKKIIGRIQKKKNAFSKQKEKTKKENYWTLEEFNYFLTFVDDYLDKLMYIFLYYSGLRLGEMIALTWNDYDSVNQTIRISKTFTNKCEGSEYLIIDPKTTNSFRTIELKKEVAELLDKHFIKESNVYNFSKNLFLFGNHIHISPTTFQKHLDKYIKLANVKRITPHGFRHSHVSLLINLGCDSREVAYRIGDTIQIVESTYYHLFPNKKNHTLEVLNNIKF